MPAMFRWPGKIKRGQMSNEIVAHLDMLPTLLAIAGDTQVKDKLLTGYKLGDTTYKVHLDGDNLVPYLTGQTLKSLTGFILLHQRRPATRVSVSRSNSRIAERASAMLLGPGVEDGIARLNIRDSGHDAVALSSCFEVTSDVPQDGAG